jgi:hypothetical protein
MRTKMKKSLLGNMGLLSKPPNALYDYASRSPENNLLEYYRPKSEYVSGYWRRVPNHLLGSRLEWVPGYWRRVG